MTAATPSSGERFSWLICLTLVLLVSLAMLGIAANEPTTSFADQLVKQSASAPGKSGDRSTGPQQASGDPGDSQHASATASHPLDPALELARQALARFNQEVDDYTGIIIKRERVGGALGGEARMEFKIRTKKMEGDKVVRPLQVYLKFLDPWLSRGREVIWVENANSGKLIAHEGGLKNVLRVSLAPEDKLAMLGNKYPITEIGMAKLIEKLIEKGERDKQVGLFGVEIADGFEVGGRPCQRIRVTHAQPDPRFDFHIAEIYIDRQQMIPLRYAAYMWPDKPGAPPPLEEEYTYTNVKLNVGLQDQDFNPDNPAYKFP